MALARIFAEHPAAKREGAPFATPMQLRGDCDQATQEMYKNGFGVGTRAIDSGFAYLKDLQWSGMVELGRIPSRENPADPLTKVLPTTVMERHIEAIQ